jgi:hypothetical protein
MGGPNAHVYRSWQCRGRRPSSAAADNLSSSAAACPHPVARHTARAVADSCSSDTVRSSRLQAVAACLIAEEGDRVGIRIERWARWWAGRTVVAPLPVWCTSPSAFVAMVAVHVWESRAMTCTSSLTLTLILILPLSCRGEQQSGLMLLVDRHGRQPEMVMAMDGSMQR